MKKYLPDILFLFVLTFVFVVVGVIFPTFVLLDASFGLGYLFFDSIGMWRAGPRWIMENPGIAIFCYLIFPWIASFLWSVFILWTHKMLSRNAHSERFQVIFFSILILILICFQSSPEYRYVSYFGFWASNY